jgi:glutamine synthetase
MAQTLALSLQCPQGIGCNSRRTVSTKLWNSLWVPPHGPRPRKAGNPFKVLATKAESTGVVSRLEDLLNLDTKPYTDKIIAEYIW